MSAVAFLHKHLICSGTEHGFVTLSEFTHSSEHPLNVLQSAIRRGRRNNNRLQRLKEAPRRAAASTFGRIQKRPAKKICFKHELNI